MSEHPEFDPIAFLETAVQHPSNEDVEDVREFLVETIRRHADPSVQVTVDDHGNTLARTESTAPAAGPHLVFNTHLDTVSPHVPFERDQSGTDGDKSEVIRGRGACDAKGPLAAMVSAFLSARPETGRLTLAVTPDEETLSTGAAALTGRLPGTDDALSGDMYVVGEPTELDVCTAAKGRFQGTIDLDGVGAHAAEPESGVNAVAALEGTLTAIRRFDDGANPHPQLGAPSLVPTTVEGGESTNQVPASCRLVVDRRPIPPETADEFRTALEAAVREEVPDNVGVSFALTDRPSPFLESFATDPDHELVKTLSEAAATAATGDDDCGDVRPFAAATEASYFAPAPTVVFGPGSLADETGPVAHADREYVSVTSVRQAATALSIAVRELLGRR
ncbi:acetylornithine deacetylase [Halalkaliarchaeum desulfuricum]|uniref:Acetylornithine deacetylase n=1 Tax=Halalkaliarchaeum desulfuricum TaxID=2055893 RepID=A0A343TL10_9EURY|nr:M20 family metallopeptidase [Halalkaliarchaeum desulfuricum]AUX09782.1 acetylornithine deacetylase [Halalkaliarchaeum desulfuricum]